LKQKSSSWQGIGVNSHANKNNSSGWFEALAIGAGRQD
jgi:hypothetical protein